ncbi:hypothetical protein JET18_00725 [Chryseobacterium sp. L7]|uniref:Uncharacterized protein n=1 Tax=Chryseobacterium endalhagicum TaxID=2797638 RepID=A0ABS1Q9R6_9FLAO|nr:hypothetical protein [Chryseobacterium endalhagicum]MBL1219345.1 hypothetical protein [Chryseobacterium endalhagicum]
MRILFFDYFWINPDMNWSFLFINSNYISLLTRDETVMFRGWFSHFLPSDRLDYQFYTALHLKSLERFSILFTV